MFCGISLYSKTILYITLYKYILFHSPSFLYFSPRCFMKDKAGPLLSNLQLRWGEIMPETRLPLRRWCAHTRCTHTLYIIHGTLSSLLLLATLEGKHTNTHNLRRGFYRFNLTVSVHSAEKQTSVERKESIICHVSVSSVCVCERETQDRLPKNEDRTNRNGFSCYSLVRLFLKASFATPAI